MTDHDDEWVQALRSHTPDASQSEQAVEGARLRHAIHLNREVTKSAVDEDWLVEEVMRRSQTGEAAAPSQPEPASETPVKHLPWLHRLAETFGLSPQRPFVWASTLALAMMVGATLYLTNSPSSVPDLHAHASANVDEYPRWRAVPSTTAVEGSEQQLKSVLGWMQTRHIPYRLEGKDFAWKLEYFIPQDIDLSDAPDLFSATFPQGRLHWHVLSLQVLR